jgi:hypothetical protein
VNARLIAGVCCLALLTTACSPPHDLASGVNGYSTDIVLGSQTKPDPPPPVSEASPNPTFPSFIVPSPPLAPVASGPSSTFVPPPPVTFPDEPCPVAGPNEQPLAVTPDITKAPKTGVYSYRQRGSFNVNGKDQEPLPADAERTLTNLVTRADGTFSYDVVILQFGSTTTTSYEFVKRGGQSDVDGIYITRTVMTTPGQPTQSFEPIPPGLKILPIPAKVGQTWSSVAADPLRGTATTLDGAVKEIGRVDACGKLVDGWFSQVKIATRLLGTAENSRDLTIDVNYIIATQLGGLVVADNSSLKGTDRGATVTQQTDSIANSLEPVRPVPKPK